MIHLWNMSSIYLGKFILWNTVLQNIKIVPYIKVIYNYTVAFLILIKMTITLTEAKCYRILFLRLCVKRVVLLNFLRLFKILKNSTFDINTTLYGAVMLKLCISVTSFQTVQPKWLRVVQFSFWPVWRVGLTPETRNPHFKFQPGIFWAPRSQGLISFHH